MSRTVFTDRKKSAVGKHWTAKDKIKAIAAWLVLGKMPAVAEQTGIPLNTLNYWRQQPWWFEQVEKIRAEENLEVDNTYSKIVKKTQEVILDRLEHGDAVVTKDGSIIRRPVLAKDASLIGAVAFDKRAILRDIPQSELQKVSMSERLQKLEMQFTNLVTEKIIEGEVIHAEDSGTSSESIASKGSRQEIVICDSDESVAESGGSEAGFSGTDSEGDEAWEYDPSSESEGSSSEILGEIPQFIQVQSQNK